ncbi:MAG: hypothetical protein WC692_06990 [Erythrobacter sp.]|jgi:hypothetical protein
MYSQDDLNSAVAAGAISAEAADALRAHVAAQRYAVPADAEHFRLITGFNDVFVSIGVVIMLVAMAAIGDAIWSNDHAPSPASGVLVAGTAWMLAEFFTAKRRMALPSIILLLAFVGGIFVGLLGLTVAVFGDGPDRNETLATLMIAGSGLITAGAAWLHWKRFMVPITIAAGTAALAGTVIALTMAIIGPSSDNAHTVMLTLVFLVGLAVFAIAMRWDMSDTARSTRRSDVAFWLHLLAAPMIAHPVFALIGVTEGQNIGISAALAVLAVYLVFGLVALAVDRRALLVSALAYVLIALTFLFREFGAVELNFALTALVIGSALLTLSALWTPIRRAVLAALPGDMRGRLPITA